MSFFGFDATLPGRGGHNDKAPGFGATADPFAGLRRGTDDDDGVDFEDTYDGLGDRLEETGDDFNADTFGASLAGMGAPKVGTDFDFSGHTNKMQNTMQDEHMLYSARQPAPQHNAPRQQAKPTRSGYERYQEPGYIPNLEASASIWGTQVKPQRPQSQSQPQQQFQPPQHASQPSISAATRKMMSLEEVEAMMRSHTQSASPQPPLQPTAQPPAQQPQQPQQPQQSQQPQQFIGQPVAYPHQQSPFGQGPSQRPPQGPQILQRPQQQRQQQQQQHQPAPTPMHQHQRSIPEMPAIPSASNGRQGPQILQRPPPSGPAAGAPGVPQQQQMPPAATMHHRGPSYGSRVITHPQQLMELTDEDRAALLADDAKRAKRNHKIHLLSKDNGLMTPQDKNFITRIQLQQLVTATGSIDDAGPDASLAEDFYYQVYTQIRGAPRQDPNQPLNHFAQTYLHQTAGRGSRRFPHGGQNQMRRMEQQVQRAVEAAKARPKNKQLVVEGSLGKISFSNAKTPKPLLNLKRPDSLDGRAKPRLAESAAGKISSLRHIEAIYVTLMKMEDHERRIPPPPREESSADEIQNHMDWTKRLGDLNQQLWTELKVLEPIDPSSPIPHPFMAILSHSKGKKLIPRIFRQIDEQQRVTILTMIVVHLDMLDVIRQAVPHAEETQLPREVRDQVELFSQAVMPSLFNYVNDAQFGIIIGLVGLIMDRVNLQALVRTKIGLSLLTMFISRAELIKQNGGADEGDLEQWNTSYNKLFDLLEPLLGLVFPTSINAGDDMYVWQFLAAMGIGASPDQQQRLVLGVKDRVMDTVSHAKTLPDDLGRQRLDNVNLFLGALGLHSDLLA